MPNPRIPKLPRGSVAAISNVSGIRRKIVRRALAGGRSCDHVVALTLDMACHKMGLPTHYENWRHGNWLQLRRIIRDYWSPSMAKLPPMPVRVFFNYTKAEPGDLPERFPDCLHYDKCLNEFAGLNGAPEGVFGCRACPDYCPVEQPAIHPGEENLKIYALMACVFNRRLAPAAAVSVFIGAESEERSKAQRKAAAKRKGSYWASILRALDARGKSLDKLLTQFDITRKTAWWCVRQHRDGPRRRRA